MDTDLKLVLVSLVFLLVILFGDRACDMIETCENSSYSNCDNECSRLSESCTNACKGTTGSVCFVECSKAYTECIKSCVGDNIPTRTQ